MASFASEVLTMAHLHISSLSSHTVATSHPSSPMPPVTSPLSLVDSLFASDASLSSLNSSLLQLASAKFRGSMSPSDSLATFRCFVQDMFDPEFFAQSYDLVDASGNRHRRTGLYRDFLETENNFEIDEDSVVNAQKFSFRVNAVPATNEWVSKAHLDEDTYHEHVKRARTESNDHKKGQLSALIRVYEPKVAEEIKLNDVVDVVAIVEQNKDVESKNVPVLHVIQLNKLEHCNPFIELWPSFKSNMAEYRSHLHLVLTNVCLGDALAADFLLMHLLSHVYARKTELVIGKCALNLYNLPNCSNYTQRLTRVLSLLTERLLYISLSVESLNKDVFVPKKNYDKNVLESGILQLPRHTHLVLDETKMRDGQLSEKGVRNLAALGNLIRWQKVTYDFQFSQIDFDADVACLVLSEGRSLLTCDTDVALRPSNGVVDESFVDSKLHEVETCLSEASAFVNFVRCFLTLAKQTEFVVNENAQRMVESDFVEERQRNPEMKADDLHNLLVLARLLALSEGRQELDEDLWNRAKLLESQRRERSAQLPRRQPNVL